MGGGEGGQLGPVGDPELGVDVRHVRLDGAGGRPTTVGTLWVGALPCDSRLGAGELENQVS